MADPIVLIGTGTSVGKTHVAERLLRAFGALGVRAHGYKPIESGVDGTTVTDAARLAAASFHVKHLPARAVFRSPISPHLAARLEGGAPDLSLLRRDISILASLCDRVVVELPGGAFSPLTDNVLVADFTRSIPEATVLLVAPDRLGVLHEVGATARACAAVGLPLRGVVLSAPGAPDDSTGRNAGELRLVSLLPLLAALPRQDPHAPVPEDDPALALARALIR